MHKTTIINLFTYALPVVIGTLVIAYAVMQRFINKNEIKIDRMKLIPGMFFVELPSKYSDAYRARFGKMGPGIKLLILGMALFFTFWLSVAAFLLLDALK